MICSQVTIEWWVICSSCSSNGVLEFCSDCFIVRGLSSNNNEEAMIKHLNFMQVYTSFIFFTYLENMLSYQKTKMQKKAMYSRKERYGATSSFLLCTFIIEEGIILLVELIKGIDFTVYTIYYRIQFNQYIKVMLVLFIYVLIIVQKCRESIGLCMRTWRP